MTEIEKRAMQMAETLRNAGMRITPQREVLFAVIAESEDHPDVVELYRRSAERESGISISTIYRTLAALEGQGVIQRLQYGGSSTRYKWAETPLSNHMIEIDTGRVIEFCSDQVEQSHAEVAEKMGYEVVQHRLELYVRKKPEH